MVHGPEAALEIVEGLRADGPLGRRHRLEAVRGPLLEMAGQPGEARVAYEIAAGRADNVQERNYLLLKIAELGEDSVPREEPEEGG